MATSSVATWALPISRSLISASWSQSRQNAMLCRLMYGFCAQDSSRTSRVPWAPAIWLSSAEGTRYWA